MRLLRYGPAGTVPAPTSTSGALALAPDELVARVELVEISDEPPPDAPLEQAVDEAEHLVRALQAHVDQVLVRPPTHCSASSASSWGTCGRATSPTGLRRTGSAWTPVALTRGVGQGHRVLLGIPAHPRPTPR